MASFEELLAEGSAVPVDGWDFSWFEGRATEERPPWGYARMLGERMAALADVPGSAALDVQTGGGEVLATIPAGPPTLVATESWPPNIEVARRHLAALGARVVRMEDEFDDLPFGDAAFDLVLSRHPVGVRWEEVARVLKPGGSYFSQDVGHGSVGELTEFLMGPQPEPAGPTRAPKWSVLDAEAAGLTVVEVREFRGRMEFYEAARAWIERRSTRWGTDGLGYWTVRLRLARAVIGAGGVERRPGFWNLYCRLDRNHWGSGYATELARTAQRAAVALDPDLPLVAWIHEQNIASQVVAQHLGLTDYGQLEAGHWKGEPMHYWADREPAPGGGAAQPR